MAYWLRWSLTSFFAHVGLESWSSCSLPPNNWDYWWEPLCLGF
jgi:hypothetical protein